MARLSVAVALVLVALVATEAFIFRPRKGQDSCAGRCGPGTDPDYDCNCNTFCQQYNDCCDDYADECLAGEPLPVTNAELEAITDAMWSQEYSNNAGKYVSINIQGQTSQGSTSDKSPLPLLTVDPEVDNIETIRLVKTLHDNYIKEVNKNEVVTDEERAEEKAFLDAVFETPSFKLAKDFLISKRFVTEANIRSEIERIWFGQYSRANGYAGSSGFEHVFMGEIKSGVSGFHNWVFWDREENQEGTLNYNGYMQYRPLENKGALIQHNFVWENNHKPISSMFVGTSPEYELALFTVCWYSRPNGACSAKAGSANLKVTTYDITYNGAKYVASSYADFA